MCHPWFLVISCHSFLLVGLLIPFSKPGIIAIWWKRGYKKEALENHGKWFRIHSIFFSWSSSQGSLYKKKSNKPSLSTALPHKRKRNGRGKEKEIQVSVVKNETAILTMTNCINYSVGNGWAEDLSACFWMVVRSLFGTTKPASSTNYHGILFSGDLKKLWWTREWEKDAGSWGWGGMRWNEMMWGEDSC